MLSGGTLRICWYVPSPKVHFFGTHDFSQKLVNKNYNKMFPPDEDGENADGDGKGKSKTPNLNRLIKSRLQKLVDKTDDS